MRMCSRSERWRARGRRMTGGLRGPGGNNQRADDAPGVGQDGQRPGTPGTGDEKWTAFRARIKDPMAVLALPALVAAILVMIIIVIDLAVPVPLPTAIAICITIPALAMMAALNNPAEPAKRVWHAAVIIALLGITAIAMWLGFQDVVWAVSLPALILGGFFMVASITTFTGFLIVTARALPFAPERVGGNAQSACVAGAAVAGLYVTLTIVAHSFRYESVKALLFAILAAICLILAIQTLPAAWNTIGNFVKGAGITLALLGAAANFWFQSVYLPENTQEGIQYGATVDSVVKSGGGRVATLDFSMENQSSVTAITLGTMVVVRELLLPASPDFVSGTAAQTNINNYAQDLFTQPAGSAVPNPNIGTDGKKQATILTKILTIIQPIGNNSDLHPNDTVSREFDVVIPPIPKGNTVALEVLWHVLYARSTRLTLGTYYGSSFHTSSAYCRDYERSAWSINQSALVRFTRGAQIFYSFWCTDLSYPTVQWSVQTASKPHETRKVRQEIGTDIGVSGSNREEIIVLPGT